MMTVGVLKEEEPPHVPQGYDFLVDLSDYKDTIDLLLSKIPEIFAETASPRTCMGSALQVRPF